MRGAIPPLPKTPTWRGAHLKHRDNFKFNVILSIPLPGTGQEVKRDETYTKFLLE
jgi:hypothetical protein